MRLSTLCVGEEPEENYKYKCAYSYNITVQEMVLLLSRPQETLIYKLKISQTHANNAMYVYYYPFQLPLPQCWWRGRFAEGPSVPFPPHLCH